MIRVTHTINIITPIITEYTECRSHSKAFDTNKSLRKSHAQSHVPKQRTENGFMAENANHKYKHSNCTVFNHHTTAVCIKVPY
jgi:hypothetical protein